MKISIIKTFTYTLVLTLFFIGSSAVAQQKQFLGSKGKYKLPTLPYELNELEPVINQETMLLHYGKHHQAYIDNLNAALAQSKLENNTLLQMLKKVSTLPPVIRNNAGGHYNHALYWAILQQPKSNNYPSPKLLKKINEYFGSFENFKTEFQKAGATLFGSGWVWLVKSNDKLKITTTINQDNPLMDVVNTKGTPILGIDVWEHAYYLQYQNRRSEYLASIWSLINWEQVEALYVEDLSTK